MSDDRPDMVNRDPNSINDNLLVNFEDVFGEPDGAHSPDCAWKCGYKCYEGARNICYKILAFLCTWYFGFCWGCDFACLTFCHIWAWTPALKVMQIMCGYWSKLFSIILECFLGPICTTCGLFFSNIKVSQ